VSQLDQNNIQIWKNISCYRFSIVKFNSFNTLIFTGERGLSGMKGEQGTIGQKGNAGEQGLPVSLF
jgi:hypothetical protein